MYNNYLETEVLTADPVKLVRLLFRGALESTIAARGYLLAGNIRARSSSIMKAHSILLELSRSLDHNQGGSLSNSLAVLYDYMQRRLLEGNAEQSDPPLQEVECLLITLLEAWQSCPTQTASLSMQLYTQDFECEHQPLSYTY
ncbi:MAG TPA: flagellar export chaperone FliS [Bryobacteraceae bacterium]|nr:flagellar export chaperone FliS [Bryobacteraceae bacterium]